MLEEVKILSAEKEIKGQILKERIDEIIESISEVSTGSEENAKSIENINNQV